MPASIHSVIVADDHALIRKGIVDMLNAEPGLSVVAQAADGLEAVALVKRHQPDLLTLDIAMPHANGIEVLEEAKRWSPNTRVLILTGLTSHGLIRQAIDAGTSAVLTKLDDGDELLAAIPKVLAGQRIIAPRIQLELDKSSQTLTGSLTGREMQVLHRIASGDGNQAIADRLNISAATVNNHRANIMRKLDVHSVAELLAIALREGLLDSADFG